MRIHRTTFRVQRGVQNATEAACRAHVAGLNQIYEPVRRRFEFAGLNILDTVPANGEVPSELPEACNAYVDIWLAPSVQGGCNLTEMDGGIISRTGAPRLYGSSEDGFVGLRHVFRHEFGHGFALAPGDQLYKSTVALCNVPIPPQHNIDGRIAGDAFWDAHADWKRDPMWNASADQDWIPLNRWILERDFRSPTRLPAVPKEVGLVVDWPGSSLREQPAIFIWHVDADNENRPDGAELEPARLVYRGGGSLVHRFKWAASEEVAHSEHLRYVQVYAVGFKPIGIWLSLLDAQFKHLVNSERVPEFYVALTPLHNPQGAGLAQQSRIVNAEPGSFYIVNQFNQAASHMDIAWAGRAESNTIETGLPHDGSFRSVQWLPEA